MAVVNTGARIGVAAFALGLSVLGPAVGVAVADSGASDASGSSASSAAADPRAEGAAVSRRAAPAKKQSTAANRRSPQPAAGRRARPAPSPAAVTRPAPAGPAQPADQPVSAPVADAAAANRAHPLVSLLGRAPSAEPVDGTGTRRGIVTPDRPSLDQRIDQAVYGVLDTISNCLSKLPVTALSEFLSGALLLVRRTFFDQAPTLNPQQLTGQVSGPITGTIGAVDPENDPITYSVVQGPQNGTLTINPDGTFSYTPGADFAGRDVFIVAASDKTTKTDAPAAGKTATALSGNWIDPRRPSDSEALVTVQQGTGPRISYTFNYFQTRYGLFVQRWSQQAKTGLEWSAYALADQVIPTQNVTLTYTATATKDQKSDTLASAGSNLTSGDAGFFPTVVQSRIQTGSASVIDNNGKPVADGRVTVNFANKWGYGGVVGKGQYDFESVMMHEFMHSFGFLSTLSEPGCNTYVCKNGKPTKTVNDNWSLFDKLTTNSARTPVINQTTFAWDPAFDSNLVGGNGGLYFTGTNEVAAFNGPVPLFTPASWEEGSSGSHLNDVYFDGTNAPIQLMNAKDTAGVVAPKALSAIEIGILKDLGYTFAAPSSV